MLNKIIEFSIKNKLIIALFTLGLIIYGIFEVKKLPIDAVPDITDNQVQIITVSPSLGAPDVERFITFPLEQANNNIAGIKQMRSFSRFGLSVITIVFKDDIDLYWAQRFTPDLEGLNVHVVPGNDHGGYWVFINKRFWPQEEYQLNPMVAFGIVLAHEFDHYNTNSKDPIPANRVDVPAFAAANAKLGKKICMECKNHNPVWRITNELEKLACECDINVGLNPKR